MSADLINSDALFDLRNMYYDGIGIQKAREYFELAANLDNSFAQLNLGNIYMNGEGVEKDSSKAVKYFELTAKQNNFVAFDNLRICYLKGQRVPKDNDKAKKFFEFLECFMKMEMAQNKIIQKPLNIMNYQLNKVIQMHQFTQV